MNVVEVKMEYKDGTLLAVIDPRIEINNPTLIVNRDCKAQTMAKEDRFPELVDIREGEKLKLFQCDPKPGEITVIAKRSSGEIIRIMLSDITPEEPFKGATKRINANESIRE